MAVDASDDASTTAAPSGPFILPEAIIIRDIIVFGLTPQFMSQHRIKDNNVFVVIARKSNAEATAMAINPITVRSTLSAAASEPVRVSEAHATGGIRIGELVMPLERVREDLMECQSRIRLVLACFSSSVLLPSRTISLWQTEAIDLSSASQLFSTMRDLYPVEGTTAGGRRLRLGCAIHISPPGAVIPRLTENMLLPDDTVGDSSSSSSGIHPHGGELACVRCLPGAEGRMMCRECRDAARCAWVLVSSVALNAWGRVMCHSTPEALAKVRQELLPFAREKCGPAALAFIDDDKMIADCISTYGFSPNKAVLALRVWLTFRYPKPEREPPTRWTVEQANPQDGCSFLSDESPFPPRQRSSLGAMPLSRKLFHEIRPTPLGSGRTGGASMDGVGARVKVPTERGSPCVVSPATMDGDNVKSDDENSRSCAVGAIRLASLQFD
ncbi:hypothetical protein FOZ61_008139 [Perkinsus olseni]|uniref:Uncharacterized protein n=1 Tax=Perkinsus olseni TaxID=32597 RepID=A0A7J6L630_PEROL|nr:hypothetical protein FOZ61_008139 [Perkinsus olseni]KAF4657683.1 hypothetical protein FOL46_007305 [Perkinsus olseni]